jgi:hypothetical protein
MKSMHRNSLVRVLGIVLSLPVFAQQSGGSAPGTSPIDVPDIIVKGSATLRLMTTSFLKQRPTQTRLLTQSELDSLNPKEKHEVLALPPSAPPQQIPLPARYRGFVSGSFGMFQTPELAASLSGSLLDYEVHADADYLSTSGYRPSTDMYRFDLRASGRQVFRMINSAGAPGGTAHSGGPLNADYHDWNFGASSMRYVLFAQPDSARTRYRNAVSLHTTFEHKITDALLRSEVSAISTMLEEGRNTFSLNSENGIRAAASLSGLDSNNMHSVWAQIDIRSFRSELLSDSYMRYQYSGRAGSFLVRSSAGVRGGTSAGGTSLIDVIGSLDVSVNSGEALRLGAALSRDVNNSFFTEALNTNPYVRTDALLKFVRNTVAAEAYALYRPGRSLSVQLRAGHELYGALPVPVFDSLSAFYIQYVSATRSFTTVRAEWLSDNHSSLVATLLWQRVTDDSGRIVPYRPALTAGLRYLSEIAQGWKAEIGMSYVSQRTVKSAAQPNDALDGYLYVDGRVEYALTDALSAFASVQNLTNSSIFVFERYVERSAFGALGLRLKF